MTQEIFTRSLSHICSIKRIHISYLGNPNTFLSSYSSHQGTGNEVFSNFTCAHFTLYKHPSQLPLPYALHCRTLFSIPSSLTYWNGLFSFKLCSAGLFCIHYTFFSSFPISSFLISLLHTSLTHLTSTDLFITRICADRSNCPKPTSI